MNEETVDMFCNTYMLRERIHCLRFLFSLLTPTVISYVSSLLNFYQKVALPSMSLRAADVAFNCSRLSERQLVPFRGQSRRRLNFIWVEWRSTCWLHKTPQTCQVCCHCSRDKKAPPRHDCGSMPREPLADCSSCSPGCGSRSHCYRERSICHAMRMLTGTCRSRFAFEFSSSPPCVNPQNCHDI